MTDERWRRIEELCHQALALDAPARGAFLHDACGGDVELRRDTVSLLANETDARHFLEPDGPSTPLGPVLVGKRVGAYEILSLLGAGGMGEVYRARDTTLGRDVALKVLPAALSADADRLMRFRREARMLASLNHPNIAAIHELEQADGMLALVLELVEGETLADRIAKGPVPIKEALRLGRQITEAVGTAHEHGIVHRDLKPANIKVTSDGTVKILDFGLAKALAPESPQQTVGLSAEGMILGTAAYMSPEQARGQAVDRRTDVWAFGCIMFEMLSGSVPFVGATSSDTIARILGQDPDWRALPAGVSPTITAYLRRCLEKNPRDRVHDIADVRLALDGAFDVTMPRASQMRWPSRASVLVAAGVLAVVALAAASLVRPAPIAPPTAMRRFAVTLAPASLDISHAGHDLAITPDGRSLVYFARQGTGRQLYVRPLDALEGTALLDAEQYGAPFVSPDGAWIGVIDMYTAAILKIPATGGPPVSIVARAPDHMAFAGASWGADDSIVFARGILGLWQVAAAGGTPVQLSAPDSSLGEFSQAWPEFLPGGKAVLFTSATREGLQIRSLNLETLEQKVLIQGASGAKYSSTGHLLYGVAEENTLRAVAFDPVRIEVLGAPTLVMQDVMGKLGGVMNFSVAADGTLAYIPGRQLLTMGVGSVDPLRSGHTGNLDATLAWFDREGNPGARLQLTEHCRNPTLSPDEQHVAVECYDAARRRDIWTVDLGRGTSERMTFEPTGESDQVWSPDGRDLLYSSVGAGQKSVLLRKTIGARAAAEERIFAADSVLYTQDISPDGRILLVVESPAMDILALPLDRGGPLKPVIQTPFAEIEPQFSPDGRYLSYASNESGRFEVYIQTWPPTGPKWKVSVGGGTDASWRRDGRELFYLRPDKTLMVVPVELSPTLRLGASAALFRAPIAGPLGGGQRLPYAATRDGQRFLIYAENSAAAPGSIDVVVNWTSSGKPR